MTIWMDLKMQTQAPAMRARTLSRNLGISARLLNALRNNGAQTVGEAMQLRDQEDLMRTPNFGRKSLREWHEFLRNHNLREYQK